MGFLGTGPGSGLVQPRMRARVVVGSALRGCDQQVVGKLQLGKVGTWVS